jgi:hypothetical protein
MVKDIIHNTVKNALIKDNWTITDDPLSLTYEELRTFVDLGAERLIGARRNNEKIAVEIKSFIGRSTVHDLEVALGQYMLYRSLLEIKEPDRHLYIAVSHITYNLVFQGKAVQVLMQRNNIPLLVVNSETEEVSIWIE